MSLRDTSVLDTLIAEMPDADHLSAAAREDFIDAFTSMKRSQLASAHALSNVLQIVRLRADEILYNCTSPGCVYSMRPAESATRCQRCGAAQQIKDVCVQAKCTILGD